MIRWSRSVGEVQSQLADGSQQSLEGEGGHWHYHAEMELTLFTEGRGNRFIGDHIGRFDAGDLVLLGGMLPHHWHARGQSAGLCLQWHFAQHHALWDLPESQALVPLFQRTRRGLHLTGTTRERVAERMEGLARMGGLARFGRLLELLATLAEAPADETAALASRSFVPPADTIYQESMCRVLRHLIGNFRDAIRLDAVLGIARMSRPTFARQFKRHTGRSLSDFLIELRLQAACHDLVESSRSMLEIALACGFSHVSFFNRVFRRTMGCSPSEYRLARRGVRRLAGVPPIPKSA